MKRKITNSAERSGLRRSLLGSQNPISTVQNLESKCWVYCPNLSSIQRWMKEISVLQNCCADSDRKTWQLCYGLYISQTTTPFQISTVQNQDPEEMNVLSKFQHDPTVNEKDIAVTPKLYWMNFCAENSLSSFLLSSPRFSLFTIDFVFFLPQKTLNSHSH